MVDKQVPSISVFFMHFRRPLLLLASFLPHSFASSLSMAFPAVKKKHNDGIWNGNVLSNTWKHSAQTKASWMEQIIPACRLRMLIAMAGLFFSLYALLLLLPVYPCSRFLLCKDGHCLSHTFHRHNAVALLENTTVVVSDERARAISSPKPSSPSVAAVVNFHEVQTSAGNVVPAGTNLSRIVFGIAASVSLWDKRREYVKVWWRPEKMRGFVWLDQGTKQRKWEKSLPPRRISENTDRFKYTNTQGHRSAIRISRIVSEMVRMKLQDVDWFVMGDDDTVFIPENLVKVLSKYDHTQYYYIGSNSESHIQNIAFSYNMAYGGGGFAISYPLAKALEKMQDGCLQRYPSLFGSDDRIQACMAELGVPLTKELGFHQYDIYGNLFGLMGSHPVTPVVSIHHLDVVDPIFPNRSRLEGLKHLSKSIRIDPAGFLQQSICYDRKNHWSISVSWGFAVQIFRGIFPPRELELPSRTFLNWYKKADYMAYSFNTRPVSRHLCQKPILFFMEKVGYGVSRRKTMSNYTREQAQPAECRWKMASPTMIDWMRIVKDIDSSMWSKAPRRKCCRVSSSTNSTIEIEVEDCTDSEAAAL